MAHFFRQIINVFLIHKEERKVAFAALLVSCVLNTLTVARYYGSFSQLSDNYHRLFVRTFSISGFDPLTYSVLSHWDTEYNVYRHPLLAFFMWPFSQLDQWLMSLTGMNFATVITAAILVACSVYSCVFLFRILKDVIEVTVRQAYVLCALYFSFSFIMLSSMVPDHFIMSMTMLLMTLYLAGLQLRQGKALHAWQTVALFTVTAGISLNNGLKVFLAALITRRKRFFRPGYLLLAVIIPSALIWGFARWEYRTYVWPKEMARNERKMQRDREHTEEIRRQVIDSIGGKDTTAVKAMVGKIKQEQAVAKYRRDHRQIWNRNTGKPIAKGEFMRWTDKTTSRWDVAVESLFGEGIMLHEDHLLGDVLRNRPVIVRYHNWLNYLIEGFLVLLFLIGAWCGRRSPLMWMAMSFFLMDMALHMGLGFGINEVYIMSAHYLFVIPVCIACLLRVLKDRQRKALTLALGGIAAYLFIWNTSLIVEYLFF